MNKRTFVKSVTTLAIAAAFGFAGSAYAAPKVIKVGVVGDYNAHWETIQKIVEKDNIKIKLVKFSDYATPNRALADGEIDMNAFQHKAFLANDIARNGYKIVALADTFVSPLAVFNNKKKIKSVKDFKKGDQIAIPSDLTNGGRALKILEEIGLIEVDPSKGFVPTKADITKYKVRVKIVEAESGILARLLPDVSAALINGGNAFTAGLNPMKDSIYIENVDPSVNPNTPKLVNILAVREKDAKNPDLVKIAKAYQTKATAETLLKAYDGAFIPVFKY